MEERNDGGIRCSEIVDVLDDFADGSLDPQTTKKVTEHLATCENCANFGAGYIAMLGLLKEQGKLAT